MLDQHELIADLKAEMRHSVKLLSAAEKSTLPREQAWFWGS
jgi:hypothetical protein